MRGIITSRIENDVEITPEDSDDIFVCKEYYHPEIFRDGNTVRINVKREMFERITIEREGYHVVGYRKKKGG